MMGYHLNILFQVKRHYRTIILLMNILSLIYLQKILHGGFQVFLIEGMNSYMQNPQ